MLHCEESANASWPSLPTNQAHAENCGLKTAMNKNYRDCNVHKLGDRLNCQRESHVEGESNERIQYTYFNQAMRENHSKRQFESIEQQEF